MLTDPCLAITPQSRSTTYLILTMSSHKVILYTRKDCCLCDDAKQVLEMYGLDPELIDIDQHTDKLAEYNECLPVVEIDGKVCFRGKVNEVLLRRILHARR